MKMNIGSITLTLSVKRVTSPVIKPQHAPVEKKKCVAVRDWGEKTGTHTDYCSAQSDTQKIPCGRTHIGEFNIFDTYFSIIFAHMIQNHLLSVANKKNEFTNI